MTARPLPFRGAAVAALALVAVSAPRAVRAQGAIGLQGYGYPTGQLSTRALATGGSIGEFDPTSALNPAALALWGRLGFAFQYDPEFRTTQVGDASHDIKIPRFPMMSLGLPVRRNFAVGVSASTLLDRTFNTRFNTTETIAGEQIQAINTFDSRGSIADVRVGAGYWVRRNLRVGVAGHLLVGENRVNTGRTFPSDSIRYRTIGDTAKIDFSGRAFSAGVDWTPVRGVGVALSYRKGGKLRALDADTTLAEGTAPDRIGVGVLYDRLTGATFAASYSRTAWSNMRSLVGTNVSVHDAPEYSVGADVAGPRIGANALLLRAGFRQRTLPFGLGSAQVNETAFSGGLGAPLAGGRTMIDLAVQRARREFEGGAPELGQASERAWTLSFGITIRP